MARIVTGLNHGHTGGSDVLERMIHQRCTDTAALIIRIHRQHINLPHPILEMKPHGLPPNDLAILEGYLHTPGLVIQHTGKIGDLTCDPALRIKGFVHESRNSAL